MHSSLISIIGFTLLHSVSKKRFSEEIIPIDEVIVEI